MIARDVCLSPAEWENALVQLQLAKQLGLIDDASPEALEARRQAKNAANARLQAAGTVFYGPRQYTPAMYLQYELTRFKLDFAQPTAAIRALPVCPVITEKQKQAYYRNNPDLFTRYWGDSFPYEDVEQIIEKRLREEAYDALVQDLLRQR